MKNRASKFERKIHRGIRGFLDFNNEILVVPVFYKMGENNNSKVVAPTNMNNFRRKQILKNSTLKKLWTKIPELEYLSILIIWFHS